MLITSNITITVDGQNQSSTNTTNVTGGNQTLVGQNQFNPVPFDEIPLLIVNSQGGNYQIGADYSLDFGGLTVIEHDTNALSVANMNLDKNDNSLSLELQCDPNDRCGTSLAPERVSIYLTPISTPDINIAENSIPTLQLGSNDCGNLAIEDCTNFGFYIPGNIVLQEYKLVVEMSFDEAEWIFINPVEIIDSIYAGTNNVQVRCDDLALALITWDQLLSIVPDGDPNGDIAENEHELNENGVEPDLYSDIIDQNLDRLLNKVKTHCNLDTGMETMINAIQFELPF
ncbi:MAG: hypothetical protein ACE5SW_13145 [Nitrososphaeraceae archaeon]